MRLPVKVRNLKCAIGSGQSSDGDLAVGRGRAARPAWRHRLAAPSNVSERVVYARLGRDNDVSLGTLISQWKLVHRSGRLDSAKLQPRR